MTTKRDHLQPSLTVDKNGKTTTVYRKPVSSGFSLSMPPVQTPAMNGLPQSLVPLVRSTSGGGLKEHKSTIVDAFNGALGLHSEEKQEEVRLFVADIEPVTARLLAVLIETKVISNSNMNFLLSRSRAMRTNDQPLSDVFIRDYIMLAHLWDKRTNPAPFHQYLRGLYQMKRINDPDALSLNITTDDELTVESALLRFGLACEAAKENSPPAFKFNDLYSQRKPDLSALMLKSDMEELIRRRPEDIDFICALSTSRGITDATVIEELLDASTSKPLGAGVL